VFSEQWVSVVLKKIELSYEKLPLVEDKSENESDETIRDRVLLNLGLYYDFAVRRLLTLNRQTSDLRAIAGVHDNTFFVLAGHEHPEKVTIEERWAFDFTFSYFMGLRTSSLLAEIRKIDKIPKEPFKLSNICPKELLELWLN
jgi:hypothetical protein